MKINWTQNAKKRSRGLLVCLLVGLAGIWTPPVRAVTLYAMDSKQTLWLLDTKGNRGAGAWTHYTMSGSVLTYTHGIDIDDQGNLYAANTGTYGNDAISKITISETTATVSRLTVGLSTTAPWDVSVEGDYLFIADGANNRVVRCKRDGTGGGKAIGGALGANSKGIVFSGADIFVNSGASVYRIANATNATPGTAEVVATATGGTLSGLDFDGTTFYATTGSTIVLAGMSSLATIATRANTGQQPVAVTEGRLFVGDGVMGNIYEYTLAGAYVRTYSPGAGQTFYGLAVKPPPPPRVTVLVIQ